MMDFDLIDRRAKSVFGTYTVFTEALRSIILNFILNSGQPSPLTKRLAEQTLATVASSTLQNISDIASRATFEIGASESIRSGVAGVVPAVAELNASAAIEIEDALKIQIERDLAVARGYISKAALIGQSVHSILIKTKDRAGRAWDSSLMAQKLVRGHLINHGADAFVVAVLSRETDRAFSFQNEMGDQEPFALENYFETKSELLHPNARWWVV